MEDDNSQFCFPGPSEMDAVLGKQGCSAPTSPDPVKFGYFNGNAAEEAQRVCVVVANYPFDSDPELKREGNNKDLINLRKTFEMNRKCKYLELASPPEKELLEHLENQDNRLMEKLNLRENEKPSVLIVFVLSHGDEGGKILTETPGDELTTYKVINSLQKAEVFKDSLKIVFFAPCRGPMDDFYFFLPSGPSTSTHTTTNAADSAFKVTSLPNEKDFVIVYSVVETKKAWRDGNLGTWLVWTLCQCLNSLAEDTTLPDLLTMVKSKVQTWSQGAGSGQTVQAVHFPHKSLTINKCVNEGLKIEKFSYPERSDTGQLRKKKVFIYCADKGFKSALEAEAALNDLHFDTKPIFTILDEAAECFKAEVRDESFDQVGFTFFCIFGKIDIDPTDNLHRQICIQEMPIMNVISKFLGFKDEKLAGKLKVFIFVDRTMQSEFPAQVLEMAAVQGGTHYSGVLIVILPGKDAGTHLASIFAKLKAGETLQNAIHHVTGEIYKEKVVCRIYPQIISTVPYSVRFPLEFFVWPTLKVAEFCQKGGVSWQCDVTDDYISSDIGGFVGKFLKPNAGEEETGIDSSMIGTQVSDSRTRMGQMSCASSSNSEANIAASEHAKIFLVSSAAGMGKTLLTKNICHSFKKQFPATNNVFEIRLSEASSRSYLGKRDISILGLIEATNKVKCDLRSTQLICLDGFDEISVTSQKKVLELIGNMVKDYPNVALWITTRPHEEPAIKEVLQLFDYIIVEMKPLDEGAQKKMFSFYSKRAGNEESFEKFKGLIGSKSEELLGNPLLFKMAMEAVKERCGQQELNICDIYDYIIRKKLGKSLGDKDLPEVILKLAKAATTFLGEDPDFSYLGGADVEVLNKTGIISVNEDMKGAKFEHRTLAEYLVVMQVLKLTPNQFEGELSYMDIFQNSALVHCRHFLEQYFMSGTSMKRKNFVENVKNLKDSLLKRDCRGKKNFAEICCKEGHFSLFKMIPRDGTESYSCISNFVFACKSNEDLALFMIERGFDITLWFQRDHCNQMIDALGNVLVSNFKILFEKLLNEWPVGEGNFFQYLRESSLKGFHPLHIAVEHGHLEMLKYIVARGENITNTDPEGNTVLHVAAKFSDVKVIKYLMEHGLHPSDKDSNGQNSLHYAATRGNLDIVNFLIALTEPKLDVNAFDNEGQTALHMAAQEGHPAVVKALCDAGANILIQNKRGDSSTEGVIMSLYDNYKPLANNSKDVTMAQLLSDLNTPKLSSYKDYLFPMLFDCNVEMSFFAAAALGPIDNLTKSGIVTCTVS